MTRDLTNVRVELTAVRQQVEMLQHRLSNLYVPRFHEDDERADYADAIAESLERIDGSLADAIQELRSVDREVRDLLEVDERIENE